MYVPTTCIRTQEHDVTTSPYSHTNRLIDTGKNRTTDLPHTSTYLPQISYVLPPHTTSTDLHVPPQIFNILPTHASTDVPYTTSTYLPQISHIPPQTSTYYLYSLVAVCISYRAQSFLYTLTDFHSHTLSNDSLSPSVRLHIHKDIVVAQREHLLKMMPANSTVNPMSENGCLQTMYWLYTRAFMRSTP